MNYPALDKMRSPTLWDAEHIHKLIDDQEAAIEALFRIATGTSSAEHTARVALVNLGVFNGQKILHSVEAGFLTGYTRDQARMCLTTEKQLHLK